MKKFLTRLFFTFAVLSMAIAGYGLVCDTFFNNPDHLDHTQSKRAWCLKKQNGHYDLAVIGSSRAFGSFDMHALQKSTGGPVINLGANGSGYLDNFIVLHKFILNENKIERLLVEVDIYALNSKQNFSNAFHAYQFIPYWSDPVIKEAVSRYLTKRESLLWSVYPPIRYFKYNKYFSPKEMARLYLQSGQKVSGFDSSLGGPIEGDEKEEATSPAIKASRHAYAFDSTDLIYLDKIIALCRSNNIPVLAYKAPEMKTQQDRVLNYDSLNSEISLFLSERNVLYIEPPASMATEDRNFANATHLNDQGRDIFTKFFTTVLPSLENP